MKLLFLLPLCTIWILASIVYKETQLEHVLHDCPTARIVDRLNKKSTHCKNCWQIEQQIHTMPLNGFLYKGISVLCTMIWHLKWQVQSLWLFPLMNPNSFWKSYWFHILCHVTPLQLTLEPDIYYWEYAIFWYLANIISSCDRQPRVVPLSTVCSTYICKIVFTLHVN